MVELHLGTSAFTAAGWEGSFYPEGMKPADFLSYYATKFDTVEVDSTFYHAPSVAGNPSGRAFSLDFGVIVWYSRWCWAKLAQA
jgi:hypothetical protein